MNAKARTRTARRMRLLGALVLGLAAVSVATATVLTDARLTLTPEGGAVLRLAGDGGFEPRHFLLEDPYRIVLDLVGTADPVGVILPPEGGLVRTVRYASRPPREGRPVVRYVVETTGKPSYSIETGPGELRLLLAPALPAALAAPAAQSAPPMATAPKTEPLAAPKVEPVVAPKAETVVAPKAEAAPAPKTAPAIPAKVETAAAPRIEPAIAPKAETAPAPRVESASPAAKSEPAVQAKSQPVALATATSSVSVKPAAAPPPVTPSPASQTTPPLPVIFATDKPYEASPAFAQPESATRMSLDVQGADVMTVLRSIADYADVNIVADANVSGSVTVRALDLPWPEMLDAVCEALDLEAVDTGSVIRVTTRKTAREEQLAHETSERKQEEFMPLGTRIVPVDYANATELQETLAQMVSERGHVEVDKRTNALVVTDIEPRIAQIEAMVRTLDSETVQVEICAKIVDVDATQSRQLGISWGLQNLHSSSANANGSVGVDAATLLDPPGEMRIGVVRAFGEIEAQLQALEQSNKAEIISTPRITTVDNRMARILAGKEVPLITLDYAGNAITELKKVGIALEVTPHVNADNQITMDIHPEVSDLASQSTAQGGVVFTITEANTRVLVEDGETAVIAGLIRGAETRFERGVPYLKDIPLLGALFRSSDQRNEKRELLIFITPRIVRPGAR
jgi:type IV pilus assembly protein PilQ